MISRALDFDAIVFDLDGTLWDATAASAMGWTRGARTHGLDREITPADIGRICGLPFDSCVRTVFPELGAAPDPEFLTLLVQSEADAVRECGGDLYPGVAEGLPRLAAQYPLYILSNCHRWYLEVFFEQTGFGSLFRDSLCHGDTGAPKGENLALLRTRHGLGPAAYVGDTTGDRDAAAEAGFTFLYAAYGFGVLDDVEPFPDFVSIARYLQEDSG